MSELLASIAGVPVESFSWEPGMPGVYAFRRWEDAYYVGMAGDVERRFREHRRAGLPIVATDARVYGVQSVSAAQRLERNLVLLLCPTHNEARPAVSLNELAWFTALRTANSITYSDGPSQRWGWCPQCGELVMFFGDMSLPATFGQNCERCLSEPAWDPLGRCWELVGQVVAALVGQCA